MPPTSQVVVKKDGKDVAKVSPDADKPEPPVGRPGSVGDKALATGNHTSGAVLEVVKIESSSGGLMKVKLRYKNPTEKKVKVFSPTPRFGGIGEPSDCSWATIENIYFRYAYKGEAYKSSKPQDSDWRRTAEGLVLEPGQTSPTLWVVWGWPPPDVKKIGLFVRGIEDEIAVPLPDHDK